MRLLVLGSGAGGGLPQWNAPNMNGRAAFGRDPLVLRRHQCSLAVSADGDNWAIFNAPPDLRQQIIDNVQLHPHEAPRSSPVRAVVLTGAEIDQVAGLLHLRERQRFAIYGTQPTLEAMAMNPIFEALSADHVERICVIADKAFAPIEGVAVTAIDIPGKAPLYLERTRSDPTQSEPGDCVAYVIEHGGRRAVFAPGCAAMTPALKSACAEADLVLFDGTLFTDDEMISCGEGQKTGRRMGHMPMTGNGSTVEALADVTRPRKIFIHINNTNPALPFGSAARAQLREAGWELAEDRQEIFL